MGRVFVAGSINMDVVATAERHPRIGETVTGDAVLYFPGGNALLSAADVAAPAFAKGDIAVSQFEIPLPAISAFFHRARAVGATTILNPAPAIEFGRDLLDLVDILILNESELGLLANTEFCDTEDPARFIEAIRSLQTTGKTICVTMGKHGVLTLIEGNPLIIPDHTIKTINTTNTNNYFIN